MTNQLRDYVLYTKQQGFTFELWVRKGAKLSKEVLEAERRGELIIKIIGVDRP
jgi:hypothetical protein